MFAFKSSFVLLAVIASALAIPTPGAATKPFTIKNGQDAIAQNQQFANLTADSPCKSGQQSCVNGQFAQCVGGKFSLTPCAGGTICAALPLVNKPGTTIACTTEADKNARIAATGATGPAPVTNSSAAAAPATTSASAAAPLSSAAAPASASHGNATVEASQAQNATVDGLTATTPSTSDEAAAATDAVSMFPGA